ncbi:hypothetical protein QAD02_020288 [Eretmocerus hayati]|uniref:Uncharacterized protein n=1 Tax=Eretmocerus hayati TaxID=131215 RepID=A0ACC2PNA4_9HYME|nr:hypothetical protein QAD02_020288 [Eretmocerus hayati]
MKPQKKTANNRRVPKTSLVVKKRRALSEKPIDLDTKREKRPRRPDDFKKEIESESERKKLTQDKKKEKSQKIEPTRSKLVKKIKRKFERKNDRLTQNIDYAKEKVLYHTDQKKITTSNEIAQEVEQCSPSSHRRSEDTEFMQQQSVIDGVVDQLIHTTNVEEKPSPLPARKRVKEFEKKLAKMNLDLKRNPKTTAAKDPKKNENLTPEKECTSKLSFTGAKKESRIKSKNQTQKDTILATKKRNIPVIKNVLNKEQELVKAAPVSNRSSPPIKEEIVRDANEAKKKTTLKGKGFQEVVVSENEGNSSKIRRKKKKADDLKRIGDRKSGHKEQNTSVHKIESENDSNKSYEGTKESCSPEEAFLLLPSCIKREIFDGDGVLDGSDNDLKNPKNVGREMKKSIRKSKVLSGIDSGKSKSSINDCKNGKLKVTTCRFKNATKEENELIKLNLKIETGKEKPESTGNSEDYSDGEFDKCRPGHDSRRSRHAPSEERAMTNRMKLFGFWSGPKRHRVASLNALAKVHCLYENENGGAYLGGFCKPKPESEKCKEGKTMDYRELQVEVDLKKDQQSSVEKHHCEAKRKLRSVPGLRGKHYDVFEASTSSSDEDSRFEQTRGKGRKKKEKQLEKSSISKGRDRDENNDIKLGKPPKVDNKSDDKPTSIKKVNQKRRKKCTEPMDLKDMVVSKRMASLNASAILAASYSDEKNRVGTSSDTSSSNDSDLEFLKKRKPSDAETEKKKQRQSGSDADDLSNPSKKVVIVNQDTDVTITGEYISSSCYYLPSP